MCLAEGRVQHPFPANFGEGQVPNENISGRHFMKDLTGSNTGAPLTIFTYKLTGASVCLSDRQARINKVSS